jgi:hypothetical protein
LVWEYHFDDEGRRTIRRREPPAKYSHHCFVVARSARQFFQCASFEPAHPVADDATYRRLIRKEVSSSPRHDGAATERIIIPGYANLRDFSRAKEALLKEECGGVWQSYFQRGHWRMVLPFTRRQQQLMARQLANELAADRPPIVHLVCFPSLAINHAVVVFELSETAEEMRFMVYDPNEPGKPAPLIFDRTGRAFYYGRNSSFVGGRVNLFEIYHAWNY